MTTDLRDLLDQRLGAVVPPPGDLGRAQREGSRIRRRRRALIGTGSSAVLIAATVLAVVLAPATRSPEYTVDPLGPNGAADGLRAFVDRNGSITVGGRSFPQGEMGDLTSEARATPYGVGFYADGVPMFLDRTGERSKLEPEAGGSDFMPEMEVDSRAPLLAYGATVGGRYRVVVRDVSTGERVAYLDLGTRRTEIDAFDDGVVFLRDRRGSTAWDTSTGRQLALHRDCATSLDCRSSRVIDVRNGVLLYYGARPDGPGAAAYRLVEGAQIEARLTYSGAHLLRWSSRLKPTTSGDAPVVLDRGTTALRRPEGQWGIDTDGSVLVAVWEDGVTIYDCEVPAGRCDRIGQADSTEIGSKIPLLVGSDSNL
ncbi:hypothetical protein [Nocardioides dongkuii]|uniref:hypothetical protein n=1 Tax=Nocardioides dongkuii TaxID=2760089 RepID=UPI001878CB1C|nr:hypothetical protein [Nocardioides dongkuii]